MKKTMVLCAVACVAMAFTGCKSSQSDYKKAYLRAQAEREQEPVQEETPVVTPLVEKPSTQTTVTDNTDNVSVRTEDVTLVSGSGLKSFSVVVGSFGVKANAEGLQRRLKDAGYDAQIAFNSARNMYRVVASTYDSKASAVQSRNQFRANYPDAWLLYKK